MSPLNFGWCVSPRRWPYECSWGSDTPTYLKKELLDRFSGRKLHLEGVHFFRYILMSLHRDMPNGWFCVSIGPRQFETLGGVVSMFTVFLDCLSMIFKTGSGFSQHYTQWAQPHTQSAEHLRSFAKLYTNLSKPYFVTIWNTHVSYDWCSAHYVCGCANCV